MEPGDGAAREGADGGFLLVWEDLSVGEAGRIIDGHVEAVPAGSPLAALAGPVACDAMVDPIDTAELLDVDMDQFAGVGPFVAHDARTDLKVRKPCKANAAQDRSDGGARQRELPGVRRPADALAT